MATIANERVPIHQTARTEVLDGPPIFNHETHKIHEPT